jgi:HEAT repeat protein
MKQIEQRRQHVKAHRHSEEDRNNESNINYWLEKLSDTCEDTRWRAIDRLRHILPPDRAVPLFLRTLKNDDGALVRALACHALYDLAGDQDVKPLLTKNLASIVDAIRDEEIHVCLNAIHIVELLGAAAKSALPILNELLTHSTNDDIKGDARNAIQIIEASS